MKTVSEIRALDDTPVIEVNHLGLITYINKAFTDAYLWTPEDLKGKSLALIIPEPLRDAHHLGFSKYLTTEKINILGAPLDIGLIRKDGAETRARHFIISEKINENWVFAAMLTPIDKGSDE